MLRKVEQGKLYSTTLCCYDKVGHADKFNEIVTYDPFVFPIMKNIQKWMTNLGLSTA